MSKKSSIPDVKVLMEKNSSQIQINEEEESIKQVDLLSKATREGIWEYNLETRQAAYSNSMFDIFGYSAEEMSDNHSWWQSNIHPSDKKRIISDLHKLMKGHETVWWGRYLFRCKNGEYKPVLDRLFVVRSKTGKPQRLIGSMQDLSDLLKLQDELTIEREKQHHLILKAMIQAEEDERNEISEELHENINQLLATINLHISQAKMFVSDKGAGWITEAQSLLTDSISGISAIAKRLTPITLNALGLVVALKELLGSMLIKTNVLYKLNTKNFDEKKLDKNFQLLLYRIAEQQIHNVKKHSKASYVEVALENKGSLIRLSIKDDGVGFDPETMRFGKGFSNIQERAEAFGGSFKLSSDPGKGCLLEVVFSDAHLTNRLIDV